jgi:hypothetical protein
MPETLKIHRSHPARAPNVCRNDGFMSIKPAHNNKLVGRKRFDGGTSRVDLIRPLIPNKLDFLRASNACNRETQRRDRFRCQPRVRAYICSLRS